MRKNASLSETKRDQTVILNKEGCSKRFAKNWLVAKHAKFQNFVLYHDKKRSGRPQKSSPRVQLLLLVLFTNQDHNERHQVSQNVKG